MGILTIGLLAWHRTWLWHGITLAGSVCKWGELWQVKKWWCTCLSTTNTKNSMEVADSALRPIATLGYSKTWHAAHWIWTTADTCNKDSLTSLMEPFCYYKIQLPTVCFIQISTNYSGLLDFWTLSIIQYSKKTLKNTTFQKTDLSVLRWGSGRHPFCWVN